MGDPARHRVCYVLYLALNVVYGLAFSAADVRAIVDDPANHVGREAVAPIAQIAAARLFGPRWSTLFSIAFGTMLLSTLSAYVLIGPRVVFAMARAGQFPSIAARLTRRAGTPAVATGASDGCALFLLWTGSFENLIIYAGVGLSIFSMLAVSSIYVLRWKRPEMHRPFRTPGYPVTPAVFLLVTGLLTVATVREHPRVSLYAILSILAGVPFYYLWQGGTGRRFLDATGGKPSKLDLRRHERTADRPTRPMSSDHLEFTTSKVSATMSSADIARRAERSLSTFEWRSRTRPRHFPTCRRSSRRQRGLSFSCS